MTSETLTRTVAAVDLGSNSFHMVVARLVGGDLTIQDRLRERVALRSGMGEDRRLTAEIQDKALACLERFGQRLSGLHTDNVRAVGTNTLREARNARSFLARASERLGHPIEVISGAEEARLIYLGVAHDLSDDQGRRLVVDIGGGSTECIVGERFEPLRTDSLRMGCVTYSLRFFPGGRLEAETMEAAQLAARLELQPIERTYARLGWKSCIGSSGTILATDEILRANGWSEGGITAKGLKKLRKALVAAGKVGALEIPGLQEDRAPVIAGGVAILSAIFDALGIERMDASTGALREGVLYDLVGRIQHEDVRDRTIRRISERYDVDVEQAERVERTALAFLRGVRGDWSITGELGEQLLSWAARLHEIGLSIAYSRYQKHGAYIVDNADLPGFSREDQHLLAALIDGHRRKLDLARFEALPPEVEKTALRLCALLRLAVQLNRSRSQEPLPEIGVAAPKNRIELVFPEGWLAAHPLTQTDLAVEAEFLRAAGIELSVR